MRKKAFAIIVVVLIGISLAFPAVSQARGGRGRGGWGSGWARGGRGWYGAGAFMGGAVLGAAIARPWYYGYGPVPYYYYPPPAYGYYPPPAYGYYPPPGAVYNAPPPAYSPNQAYAYPDQAVAAQQGPNVTPGTDITPPSGQWVEVPGQSVNGKWIPPHKAWVPDNP